MLFNSALLVGSFLVLKCGDYYENRIKKNFIGLFRRNWDFMYFFQYRFCLFDCGRRHALFQRIARDNQPIFLTSAVLFSATFLLFLFNVIFKRYGKLSSIGFIIEFLSIPLIFSFAYAAARDGFCGYEETYKISLFGLIFISIMFIFQLGLCLSPLIKRKMR